MVILNQIVGVGGFSIADNLRLIVIAAIFIGIIVVLLYLRVAKNGEKTNRKYISKEKTIKDKTGEDIEDLEDIVEYAEGTAEKPVVDFETIEEKIKNSEAEMITKFAAVIKDVRAKIDTKLTAEIEELIAKIEEREKEVVNKIENVIDTKVQEALNKMNDMVGAALHTQKNSTASVLEKLVDSLRTEEVLAGSLTSEKAEKAVKEKADFAEMEEGPVSISSSNEYKAAVEEAVVSEEAVGGTADFDMQEFLKEEPVGISFSDESNIAVEEDVVPKKIKEEELEVSFEGKADVKLEAKEPIASPGENEEKVSGKAVGDSADFDMQAFLNEEPVGISSSDESNVLFEDNVEEKLETKESIASSGKIEEKVPEKAGGDSADFDIQAFLDELENLPSEKDPEAEK